MGVPEDDITSEPTTLLGASESEAAQVSSLWKKFQLAQGAEAPPPTAEIQAHNSWDSFLKKTFPEQKPVSQTGGKVEAEAAGGPVQKAKTLKKKIKKQKKFNKKMKSDVNVIKVKQENLRKKLYAKGPHAPPPPAPHVSKAEAAKGKAMSDFAKEKSVKA